MVKILKWLLIPLITFWIGVFGSAYLVKNTMEGENFLLPRQFYECWIGFVPNEPTEASICVVYRAKGLNLDGYNKKKSPDLGRGVNYTK